MQGLAAAAHQGLALRQGSRVVGGKGRSQFVEALELVGSEGERRLAQLTGQKAAEGFAAALKIGETPFGLQVQGLLQWPQPGLERQPGGCVGFSSWALSRNHCCSASRAVTRRCQMR